VIAPPIPDDDAARVEALRSLGVLDTGREDRFDRITRLAVAATGAPIAFVSLVDTDRQVFKSCVGMGGDPSDRSSSFCGYTILSDEPLVIEDARTDPRFADNPFVVGEPHIVFYLGRPLHDPETGHRVGSLCIVDRQPRRPTDGELALVDDLAKLVEAELDRGELSRLVDALDESRRVLRRLQQRDELILQSVEAGIVGLDREGRVTFVNRAGERLLGWSADELVGRDFHAAAHHHRRDGADYPWPECPSQATLTDATARRAEEEWLWRADGTGFPAELTSTPIVEGGRVVGAVNMVVDLSDREAVLALKSEFVALVSHELRTPLTSVNGALRLLGAGLAGDLPEEAAELVATAEANAARLIRLVNDILELERLEQRRFELALAPVSAAAVARAAVAAVEGLARERDVPVSVGSVDEVSLVADHDRLVQVLTNLLGNAVKFSDTGSPVVVEATADDREVTFVVRDQGRGIPEDKLAAIFEPFAQVDASDARVHAGTGLGLAITARLVEAHGGRVRVSSTLGEGSTFTVTIPGVGSDDEVRA
jgi:PAS domain S-box-containing protein